MRRHKREKPDDDSADRGLKRARQCNACADRLDNCHGPHHSDSEYCATDPKQKQKTHVGLRKGRVQLIWVMNSPLEPSILETSTSQIAAAPTGARLDGV